MLIRSINAIKAIMNLKEIQEGYMRGFRGEKKGMNDVIILKYKK